jgi:hypothetical protein
MILLTIESAIGADWMPLAPLPHLQDFKGRRVDELIVQPDAPPMQNVCQSIGQHPLSAASIDGRHYRMGACDEQLWVKPARHIRGLPPREIGP